MDADPMQFVEEDDDKRPVSKESAANARARLNSMVAISVALLATFMAICKVKDDNIVQAMQQAQADKIDNYSWYQARNIREEVANATLVQLKLMQASAPSQLQSCSLSRSRHIRRWRRTRKKRKRCSSQMRTKPTRHTTS